MERPHVSRWISALVLAAGACSPTSTPQPEPPPEPPPSTEGWITIYDPGDLQTWCGSIHLEGEAWASAAGAVTVTWENLTTGETGPATTTTDGHVYWEADVPVAPGENVIRAVRLCPVGIPAQDQAVVQRLPASVVSGVVTSGAGVPLRDLLVKADGPVSRSAMTGSDGRYTLCLPDGEYTLSANSACSYLPLASRPVVVAGLDVDGQDFVWTWPEFPIWGWVWYAAAFPSGAEGVNVEVSGAGYPAPFTSDLTDLFGQYQVCVPPGLYDVRAVGEPWQCFSPPTTTVTVTDRSVIASFTMSTCP